MMDTYLIIYVHVLYISFLSKLFYFHPEFTPEFKVCKM